MLTIALVAAGCASSNRPGNRIYVSVPDQKMVVLREWPAVGDQEQTLQFLAEYDVSTSKFGLGSKPGSYATPLGWHKIAKKIGGGQPAGMKFKSRNPTGEIVRPDSPGRDPIVSRIIWLTGKESQNRNSYGRYIYIHGTAEERKIGQPASYGCIRMRSRDVIELYNMVWKGDDVFIINKPFNPAAYRKLKSGGRRTIANQEGIRVNPPREESDEAEERTRPATASTSGERSKRISTEDILVPDHLRGAQLVAQAGENPERMPVAPLGDNTITVNERRLFRR